MVDNYCVGLFICKTYLLPNFLVLLIEFYVINRKSYLKNYKIISICQYFCLIFPRIEILIPNKCDYELMKEWKILQLRIEHFKDFREGREEVNDDARPGRRSTSTTNENTQAVKKIVMENRRINIRKISEDFGILVGSFHAIFSDILGLKRVAAKFVPQLLNFD